MSSADKESRLWERVRRWLKNDSDLPDVVLVFGLKQDTFGQWQVNWKASHWLDNDNEGCLPPGIEVAISEEMAKSKLGNVAVDLAKEVISRAPAMLNTVMQNRRSRNGR